MARDIFAEEGINQPRDVFEAEGISVPSNAPRNLLQKAGDIAGDFNSIFQAQLGALSTGFLSAVPNAVVNIANIPHQLISDKFPKASLPDVINPEHYYNAQPKELKSPIFKMLGDVAGGVATGAGAYGNVSKALNFGAKTPLLMRALAAGLTEGAITNSDQFGGRGLAAATAAAAPALNALRPSVVGERIADVGAMNASKYKGLYNDLLSRADEAVGKFTIAPQLSALKGKASYLIDNASDAKIDALQDFIKNPSITSAHFAQSELGALSRSLGKKIAPTNIDNKLKPIVNNLREALQDSISYNLNKADAPDLVDAYNRLGKGYRQEVVPFNTKVMRDYRAGDVSAATLARKMKNNEAFILKDAAKQVPGLSAYQLTSSPLLHKLLLAGGLLGAGTVGTSHYLGGH